MSTFQAFIRALLFALVVSLVIVSVAYTLTEAVHFLEVAAMAVIWVRVKCPCCDIAGAIDRGEAVRHSNGWVYRTGADAVDAEPFWCPECHGNGTREEPKVVAPPIDWNLSDTDLGSF